jgi:2-aminoadipate transaminase
MPTTPRPFQPAPLAHRSSEQAIGYLMQQGLENPDCLSLAAGFVDPDTLPVNLVSEATSSLLADQRTGKRILQYGSTAGSPELREVYRTWLGQLEDDPDRVANVDIGQFMLTTGSQQLLCLLSQALFSEGDICLVAAPTYFVYLGVLDAVGAEAIPVKTDDDGMCPEALNQQLQELADEGRLDKVKLVYVVSYHDNPSGISVSSDRRPEFLNCVQKWSRDHTIYLLEDAAYRELNYEGDPRPSIWSFDSGYTSGDQQHVILSQTFSKSFSPGIRVGLGVLPQELVKPVSDLKGNEDFGSPHLNQNIMAHVLKSGRYEQHLKVVRNGYRTKRDAMLSACDEYCSSISGVSWRRPEGGLYVWMTLPEHIETGFESRLFKRATEVDQVMYVPGELCYPSGWKDRPKNQMRLSFGVLPPEQIREGIRRLASAVAAVLDE